MGTTVKKKLLFLVTDGQCAEKTSAAATLAWLAAEAGSEFDGYVEIQPWYSLGGIFISPLFTGNWHGEQFYFLAHFFDITFCSLSTAPEVQYRREATAIGATVMPARDPEQIADFYIEIFDQLGQSLPSEAVIIPTAPADETALWVEPFCYPDIYYRRVLGLSSSAPDGQLSKLRDAGVTTAHLLYTDEAVQARFERLGFKVQVIDSLQPGDTYGAVTSRIAERWLDQAQSIAFGDQNVTLKILPHNLRHHRIALYEPHDWRAFVKTAAAYADKVGDHLVWGNQTVLPRATDDVITEFGKYDCAMSLGLSITGPTIQEQIELRFC